MTTLTERMDFVTQSFQNAFPSPPYKFLVLPDEVDIRMALDAMPAGPQFTDIIDPDNRWIPWGILPPVPLEGVFTLGLIASQFVERTTSLSDEEFHTGVEFFKTFLAFRVLLLTEIDEITSAEQMQRLDEQALEKVTETLV